MLLFLPVIALLPFVATAQYSCSTALPIGIGYHTTGGNISGAPPPNICTGPEIVAAANWYAYTPTADHFVTVSSDLSQNPTNGDSDCSIFTGTCGNLSCVTGDDDGGVLGNGYMSVATFNAVAGTTYYIVFDSKWNTQGFSFLLTEGTVLPPIDPPVTFTDSVLSTNILAQAVVDLNGDYLDDILDINTASLEQLRQLPQGGFSDTIIDVSFSNYPSWSIAVGDIDKNGVNDLLFGGSSAASFLFANNDATGYTEFTDNQYIFCQRTNMVDINGDGNLDAFISHDIDTNVYYLNDGNGNLIRHHGGLGDHPEGGNYGSVWVDYDNDGDPDLFIAKCRGGQTSAKINQLFRNEGNGVFTDVSAEANMADPIQTWSAAWADYDNDGFMDAFIGANSSTDGLHKFMHNNGDGTFTDITAGSGFDISPSLNIENLTYDFDNDGYADVLGGGGKIMFNNHDLTFSPVQVGFAPGVCGDLNNDGFIDVINNNVIRFNSGNNNNWITLSLQGIQSNANGIGARVELYSHNIGKQIRDVRSGEGFKYMHTLNVHFGLGVDSIDSIHVIWPSGIVDYLFDTTFNTNLHIVEGSLPYPSPSTDTTTDIAHIDIESLHVYPNPANDVLYIDHAKPLNITQAFIYSTAGRLVKTASIENDAVDIKALPAGNYILEVQNNKGKRFSKNFVKLRE